MLIPGQIWHNIIIRIVILEKADGPKGDGIDRVSPLPARPFSAGFPLK